MHFGDKHTDTLRFQNIMCFYEVDPKSTYDSGQVIFFDIVTEKI